MFEEAFDTWSAALKAAKIVLSLAPEKTEQPEIFEQEVLLREQSPEASLINDVGVEIEASDYQIN